MSVESQPLGLAQELGARLRGPRASAFGLVSLRLPAPEVPGGQGAIHSRAAVGDPDRATRPLPLTPCEQAGSACAWENIMFSVAFLAINCLMFTAGYMPNASCEAEGSGN